MWKYVLGGVALFGIGWVLGYVVMQRKAKKALEEANQKLVTQKSYYDNLMIGATSPARTTGTSTPGTLDAATPERTAA